MMNDGKTDCRILILFLMFLFVCACKEPVSLQSKWLDKKITIDADDTDWMNYPFFYDGKTHSFIGLYNDDKNLYMIFETMDNDLQRQLAGRGLYIWFNKTGGKEKELGLCFPLGGGFGGPGGPGGPPGGSRDMPGPPPEMSSDTTSLQESRPDDRNMSPERQFPQGSTPDTMLKILTSEEDKGYTCNTERAARLGIEVKYNIDEQHRFIYELKMPLVETEKTAFVIEVPASNRIGMGLMTAKMERRGSPGGMGGGGMDRGGRGGGMPPGGGMGGGPGGGMGSKSGALEIWTNVTLASNPGYFN